MIKKSLTRRILVTSLVVALIATTMAGYFLTSTFENSIKKRFDQTLKSNLNYLIAAIGFDHEGRLHLDWQPTDPRFNAPLSGWYWLICDTSNTIIYQSDSLIQTNDHQLIPKEKSQFTSPQFSSAIGPGGINLRRLIRPIKNESNEVYYLAITGPVSDIDNDVAAFFRQLLITLSFLLICFLTLTYFQVKFSLSPLIQAHEEITAIRSGKLKRLNKQYPIELMPFVSEINELLTDNESIISRARLQASNLAHALKNPLTIIKNESAQEATINEQISIINQQIDRHLHKVRITGNLEHSTNLTNVADCLNGIVYSLNVLHKEKYLKFNVQCESQLFFRGDLQDLEELLGNLLDNAAKWATASIKIYVSLNQSKLLFTISDDGPGISHHHIKEIFKPGRRLDETVKGSGLGLHIVNDIVEMYQGEIKILTNKGPGTHIALILPGSHQQNQ